VIVAALLLAASGTSAIDAERDFSALAQTKGQWTAFRAYAAPGSIMFVPTPSDAQTWLHDRKDPAVPVVWWPARSWVSCDGSLAVNMGPWVRRGGQTVGLFTTVWKRQAEGGWKWLLDTGNGTPKPFAAGERAAVTQPACRNLRRARASEPGDQARPDLVVLADDRMPSAQQPKIAAEEGAPIASGASDDGSVRWQVRSLNGGDEGAHLLKVWTWDGARHRLALVQVGGVKVE
jgi:hypothetical protein